MDKKHIEFIIRMKASDMIFNQHMKSCYTTATVILVVILINIIACSLLNIFFEFSPEFNLYITAVNLVLCSLVFINIKIHKKAWDNAKKELEDIDIGLSMLTSDDPEQKKELLHKICPTIPKENINDI